MGCHQVPKEECTQIPFEKCVQVSKEECTKIPREECKQVPREACQHVPKQECHHVPKWPGRNAQKFQKNLVRPHTSVRFVNTTDEIILHEFAQLMKSSIIALEIFL